MKTKIYPVEGIFDFEFYKNNLVTQNIDQKSSLLALRIYPFMIDKLHFRYMTASFLGISDPEIKLIKLFNHLKAHFKAEGPHSLLIP